MCCIDRTNACIKQRTSWTPDAAYSKYHSYVEQRYADHRNHRKSIYSNTVLRYSGVRGMNEKRRQKGSNLIKLAKTKIYQRSADFIKTSNQGRKWMMGFSMCCVYDCRNSSYAVVIESSDEKTLTLHQLTHCGKYSNVSGDCILT